ncbi:MAG TPA: Ig-like domain-containing protein, partial [Leptospiraceae bacterium]|nr:Ig-like domain-containing protein [Leptospiraceae bacterium]
MKRSALFLMIITLNCGPLLLKKKPNHPSDRKNTSLLGMFFNRPSSLAVSSADTFDSTPPSVIGTVPFSGGTEVALDSTIQVNFSEPILSSSVNSLRFYVKENGSVLEGTIKVQSDKIYFTPKLQLLSNRVYSVTVGSEIEDGSGNRMGSDYSFQFTSARMDSVPPSVVTVSPSDGTLGVSQNAVLTVLFSEEIDPSSILKENILAVDEVGTPIQLILSLSGNILTIAPADKFTSGSQHTVTLRSQLRDLSQNTMNGDFIFQFYTADPERPYLVDTQPKNGDKNFDPRYLDTSGNSQISPVKIVFNELITSSSVNLTSFQLLYSGTPVAGNVTSDPDGKTFYFTPSTALNYNSQYTAIVTSAVSDLAGNTMLRDYTFQFYTSSFVNIVVGNNHACAQLQSGKVKCWGDNSSGQLGIGSRIPNVPSPELSYSLDFGSPVTKITAGSSHNCVLLANGGVKCWGDNSSGQLGYGNHENIRDVSRLLLLP